MKNAGRSLYRRAGFTLVEVILTVIIVAVLATMLYSYFGSAITGSSVPVKRLQTAMAAQAAMENVTSDYMANSSDLAGLKGRIGTEGSAINAVYGQGTVIDNHFITWSAGADVKVTSGVSNCLKVTVKDTIGEVLTQIYSNGSQGVNCQ